MSNTTDNAAKLPITWEAVADKALDKAGGIAEKTSDMMVTASKSVEDAITQYGPDAINALLAVIRINHLQYLIAGLALLIILAIYWFYAVKVIKHQYNHGVILNHYTNQLDSLETPSVKNISETYRVGILCSVAVTVFMVAMIFMELITVWNIVAVANPKLWIVKQVVEKMEQTVK